MTYGPMLSKLSSAGEVAPDKGPGLFLVYVEVSKDQFLTDVARRAVMPSGCSSVASMARHPNLVVAKRSEELVGDRIRS